MINNYKNYYYPKLLRKSNKIRHRKKDLNNTDVVVVGSKIKKLKKRKNKSSLIVNKDKEIRNLIEYVKTYADTSIQFKKKNKTYMCKCYSSSCIYENSGMIEHFLEFKMLCMIAEFMFLKIM